jgi:hypothetical protein
MKAKLNQPNHMANNSGVSYKTNQNLERLGKIQDRLQNIHVKIEITFS